MVMMKRVTTYFNTAHLLQYINHNSKLLQNLVQYGGVLPSTSCCPHFVRIVVYSAAGVRPSFSLDAEFSAEGECSCERCKLLLYACFCTERICFACICTEGLACCMLPSVRS